MIPNTYRRYKELRDNAQEFLKGKGSVYEQLTNAVIEISMMRKNEVPEYSSWDNIQEILKICRKHEPVSNEGVFRASINQLDSNKLKDLKNKIENMY
jgi:hypothetical protein